MKIEILIYIYMGICVSMILFNCVTIFATKASVRRIDRIDRKLIWKIEEAIQSMEDGNPISKRHKAWLIRRLRRTNSLRAFDQTLGELFRRDEGKVRRYLAEIYPAIIGLTLHYCNSDPVKTTFFVYLINKYGIVNGGNFDFIVTEMMQLLTLPNVYCREYALQVIYRSGVPEHVVQALLIVDRHDNVFHHSKLLHDGLMDFAGDRRKLLSEIWRNFDKFTTYMKTALLDYMRYASEDCAGQVFERMVDTGEDDEVRFACIRYFGKFRYDAAYPVLMHFLENPSEQYRWEYQAISATALPNYGSPETILALKNSLHNRNWYVRTNAAQALVRLRVSYAEMADVFEGRDRYAREILQYWMDFDKAEKRGAAAV